MYSPRVHKLLVNRMFYLHSAVKKLKGGRQRQEFLNKNWCFAVQRTETVFQEDLEKENCELQEIVQQLQQKVSDQANFIRKKTLADKPEARGRKRSLEEYSDRHQRRLKKERTKSCEMSLSWLEKEGYTPMKVTMVIVSFRAYFSQLD